MLTFNRIIWPSILVALILPEVALIHVGHPVACLPVLMIQGGLALFIYNDWVKPKA